MGLSKTVSSLPCPPEAGQDDNIGCSLFGNCKETPFSERCIRYVLFAWEAIFAPRATVLVAFVFRGSFKTGKIPFGGLDCADKLGFAHAPCLYVQFFRLFFKVSAIQHGKLLSQH
jgi:hypothetical protein